MVMAAAGDVMYFVAVNKIIVFSLLQLLGRLTWLACRILQWLQWG